MPASTPETSRYGFLDLARGVAIIGTLFQHMYFPMFSADVVHVEVGGVELYPFIFANGWLAVNVFFVLSGFVLFTPRQLESFDARGFYGQRFRRLFPLGLFLIVLIGVVSGYGIFEYGFWIPVLTTGLNDLVPALWMPKPLWVFWSLSIEILFSLAFPLIVLAGRRFGFWRTVAALVGFAFLYRVVSDIAWFANNPRWGNTLLNPWADNIFGRIDDFVIGMAASALYRRGWRPSRSMLIASSVVLFATLYAWNVISVTERTWQVSVAASIAHPALSASVALLIVGLMNLRLWRSGLFFPLAVIGQASYSIYLFHAFIRQYVFHLTAGSPFANPATALSFIGLTLAVALPAFVLIECLGIRKKPDWVEWLFRRGRTFAVGSERRTSG